MKSKQNITEKNARKLRFSLKGLLVAFTGAAVLCLFFFVLAPELWLLVSESRTLRKTLVAIFGIAGVFVLILGLGVAFRLGTILIAGVLEKSADEPNYPPTDNN